MKHTGTMAMPTGLTYQSKTKSWAHQDLGYGLISREPAYVLHWEMGTGKTKVLVDWICNHRPSKTLIVCPKNVVRVWVDEFAVHGHNPPQILELGKGTATTKRDAEMLKAWWHIDPLVLVGNYERIWQRDLGKLILKNHWTLVVADELHKIKAHNGRISKFMWHITTDKRIGLTGTLMPHSPLDVFGSMRFIDPSLFGTSWIAFRNRHAILKGPNRNWIDGVKPQSRTEIAGTLTSLVHRVTKLEVLDLPEFVHENRYVDLGKEALSAYRSMEDAFIAKVRGGVITASNALVKLLRLQQITSGFLPAEKEPELITSFKNSVKGIGTMVPRETAPPMVGNLFTNTQIDDAKAKALAELLEDIPSTEPVVVFCKFRHDLDVVRHGGGIGGLAARKRFELSGRENQLEEWQNRSAGDVLAVQIQAGGVGINLTRACYCVYFSMGFSLGDYEQSLARVHRGGQTKSVTYIHLIASGTVDETVYKSLAKKKNVVESILKEMQK
tara:strand:+ start:483 stop:1976 length:1494 start_codon:yes stop_codon:yes gene_type:complete